MGRLKEFFHDQIETEVEAGDAPQTEPEWLAEQLEGDTDEVQKALMLMDGTETFSIPEPDMDEGYLLPRVSTEGFGERLDQIWRTIQRFIRYLVESFTNDNKAALVACRVLSFQAENLKMEARGALMKPRRKNDRLVIQSHITALSVFYRPPGKIGDIIAGMKTLESILNDYYSYVDRTLTPGLGRITTMVRSIDPTAESFQEDALRIGQELQRLSPTTVLNRYMEGNNPKNLLGPHILGNQRLAGVGVPNNPTLNEITQSRLTLRHSELTPRRMPNQIYLPRFNMLNTDQCIDQVLRMTKTIKATLEGSAAAKRERALSDLTTAVNRFVERAGELEDGQRQEKEDAQAIAQMVRVAGQWMHNPYHGLTTNALRSMRGAIMVCRKNIE